MTKTYTSNLLKIEVTEDQDVITVNWYGKSIMRKPTDFITPILVEVLKNAVENNKRVVLDFRSLEYMNSSTITPVIKVLERARRGGNSFTLVYDKSLRWQDLSFSALKIFETKDKRVEIKGSE